MRKRLLTYLAFALALCGCIENDLPYPIRQGSVTSLEVEGAKSVVIDEGARKITVTLEEATNIKEVKVSGASYLEDITVSEPELVGVHDLSSPFSFNLHTYQDYAWTLVAEQPMERWFSVRGQIGPSVIDDVNRRIIVYVAEGTDLSGMEVSSMKLGPEGICSYNPPVSEIRDFSSGAVVTVTCNGVAEQWNLYAEYTDVAVRLDSVEPWTCCAWLSASGLAGETNGFRYRIKGASGWTDANGVESDGGAFKVCVDDLMPDTTYECMAYSGDNESDIVEFTTDFARQLPNAGFETWSNAESSVYSSWFDPSSADPYLNTKWWDSGNVGSTTVGSSYCIAMPDGGIRAEGNSSACLVSRNVIIKFAAGNTFSGEFDSLVGTQGGIINFGRPWTQRPRAMRVWLRYECGTIDVVDGFPSSDPVKLGDPDRCQVWAALGDWDCRKFGGTPESPVQINTTDKSTFFNPDTEAVIAYASFESSTSSASWADSVVPSSGAGQASTAKVVEAGSDGWMLLEIPFGYRSVDRKPTHIIVSFASSKLGDYFTGSSSSRLWVDGIQMIY